MVSAAKIQKIRKHIVPNLLFLSPFHLFHPMSAMAEISRIGGAQWKKHEEGIPI